MRIPPRIEDDEPWWLLGPGSAGRIVGWGLFFLLLSYLPLRGADLWSHVSYGEWILDHGELPREDPFLPLAAGLEVVDDAWLSQVLLALIEQIAGPEGLSVLFALTVTLTYLLLGSAFRRASGSTLAGGLGVLATIGIGWSRIASLRPETFGMLAFAILIWLLVSDRNHHGLSGRLQLWFGVPMILALWANLDGSFVVGLALLWGQALGTAFDVGTETRSLRAVAADPGVQQRFWLAELGLAATLINPYGLDLLLFRLGLMGSATSESISGQPLTLIGPGGVECALALVALLVIARRSRRPLPAAEVLPLAVFGVAAALSVQWVGWLAPVVTFVLVPHFPGLLNRQRGVEPLRSWRWTLIGVFSAWLIFAVSPLSTPILGGTPRTPEQLFDSTSPAAIADYLWLEPPSGQLFHPAPWGDWLVREGKPKWTPFVGADPSRVPRRVWSDYLAVAAARGDWQRLLERYRVETVVVDREQQPALARALRASPDWRRVHHDPQALVFAHTDSLQNPNAESSDLEGASAGGPG